MASINPCTALRSFYCTGNAMLMRPEKAETAVCHCLGDMAVRMRKVLAIPRSWCSQCASASFDLRMCFIRGVLRYCDI